MMVLLPMAPGWSLVRRASPSQPGAPSTPFTGTEMFIPLMELDPLPPCSISTGGTGFPPSPPAATKAVGLNRYIVNHPKGGPHHPNASLKWKQGDVITSTIETSNGESIIVTHDCNSPRPYSLGFRVQGSAGLTEFDYNMKRIYVEGQSPEHSWEDMDAYLEKYDHPLWKKHGAYAEGSGHGGMDFFVDHAFVEIVKRKLEAPMDAYDAAAWSAITPLSELIH